MKLSTKLYRFWHQYWWIKWRFLYQINICVCCSRHSILNKYDSPSKPFVNVLFSINIEIKDIIENTFITIIISSFSFLFNLILRYLNDCKTIIYDLTKHPFFSSCYTTYTYWVTIIPLWFCINTTLLSILFEVLSIYRIIPISFTIFLPSRETKEWQMAFEMYCSMNVAYQMNLVRQHLALKIRHERIDCKLKIKNRKY